MPPQSISPSDDELFIRARRGDTAAYRIAHHVIIDQHRMHKTTLSLDQTIEIRDESANPEDRWGWHESVGSLTRALQQLPLAYQQVLALRFISGLSHAETGRMLGRSEEAVRVLQHPALSLRSTQHVRNSAQDAFVGCGKGFRTETS